MKRYTVLSLIALSSIATLGCSSGDRPTSADKPKAGDVASLLVQADKVDGTEDHTIGKCYVCSLGMDGSAEFSAKFNDYTAHLCSEACQKQFEAGPEKVVLETPIPKSR